MATAKSVIYVGAHPDDIASVAGTMLLLKRKGYRVHDFCLTHGEKGGPQPDMSQIRTREELEVGKILDAEVRFFGLRDGEIYADQSACEAVAEAFAEVKPVAIISMWPLEKPDHGATFGVAHKALCLADMRWTCEFYMAQSDLSGCVFQPDLYVNISSVVDDVRRIVGCYGSRWSTEMCESLMDFKRQAGVLSWCTFAEGFKTNLPMVNERWQRRTEVGRVLLDL